MTCGRAIADDACIGTPPLATAAIPAVVGVPGRAAAESTLPVTIPGVGARAALVIGLAGDMPVVGIAARAGAVALAGTAAVGIVPAVGIAVRGKAEYNPADAVPEMDCDDAAMV